MDCNQLIQQQFMCCKSIMWQITYIHYNDLHMYIATPQQKNSSPWGHEIYNLGRPFTCHHFYIHNMSNPCPSVDKKRRNLTFTLYGHAPAQEPPFGGQDLQFCRLFLRQYYYLLSLSDLSLGVSPYELYCYFYGRLLSIFLKLSENLQIQYKNSHNKNKCFIKCSYYLYTK